MDYTNIIPFRDMEVGGSTGKREWGTVKTKGELEDPGVVRSCGPAELSLSTEC